MSKPSRFRVRLALAAALAVATVTWLLSPIAQDGSPPSPAPRAPADAGAPDAAPPPPPPEPEHAVLLVTVKGADGPVQTWVTGLNVWPARSAEVEGTGDLSIRFEDLPEGEVQLWARTATQVAGPSEAVRVREGKPAQVELVMGDAAPLRGHVRSTSGAPLADARVAVLPPEPSMPRDERRTDAHGDFGGGVFFEPIAHLWVRAEGHVDAMVEAVPHRPVTVVLEPTRRVRGRVQDARGQPLEGARVWAVGIDGEPVQGSWQSRLDRGAGELGVVRGDIPRVPLAMAGASAAAGEGTRTDAQGRFVLEGLRPRTMYVLAEQEGHARARARVEAIDPADALVLTLEEGGRVFGTVRDPRDYEVAGIDVRLDDPSTSTQRWTASDAHGEFRFDDVHGAVRVAAFEHGTRVSECALDVRAGDALDCALTVGKPRGDLHVSLEDDRGQAIPGAVVQLSEPGSQGDRGLQRRRLTDPDGQAVFASLPVGRYRLELSARGFVTPPEVEVDTDADALSLVLERAGSAAGTVVDQLGAPVAGAEVRARDTWGKAVTDADGHFVLDGLAPGTVRLVAAVGSLRSSAATARIHAEERVEGIVLHLDGRARDLQSETDETVAAPDPPEAQATPTVAEAPSLLAALELGHRNGRSVVGTVRTGSEAARAGFRTGDVLTHVDGEPVLTAAQALGMLRDPPGRVARVRVLRGGEGVTLRFRRPELR